MVDRGPFSIEILIIISKLKLLNWDQVFIINGNHEDRDTYNRYGFSDEMKYEVNKNNNKEHIHTLLKLLPTAVFLKFNSDDKWYQFCHGGIDKNINPGNFLNSSNSNKILIDVNKLDYSYNNGLKWSDFSDNEPEFRYNIERGAGYIYGPNATKNYLIKNNIHSIISGHQDNVNLALLTEKDKPKSYFRKCDRYRYNLLCPEQNLINEKILLNPEFGGDFLALITSTCTESKDLPYDSYLKLSYKI